MAARKKKPAGPRQAAPPTDATHQFTVVLENVQGQMKAIGEGQQLLNERMDSIDHRFERVEHDIGLLKDASLEQGRELKRHGRSLDEQGAELKRHGQLLDEQGAELKRHGQLLDEHGAELKRHGHVLADIRSAIDTKVDRDEVEAIVRSAIGGK